MQVKIFTIPVLSSELQEEELNKFLRTNRILHLESQFFQDNAPYWTIFVTYMEGNSTFDSKKQIRGKIDYRETLSEEEFARFAKYREIRKQLASEEAVPPFVIFTDEELSFLSKYECLKLSDIKSIKGVGDKKAEKYGKYFIDEQTPE